MRARAAAVMRYRVEPLEPRVLLAADWTAGLAPSWSPEAEAPASNTDVFATLSDTQVPGAVVPGAVAARSSSIEAPQAALDLEALRSLGNADPVDAVPLAVETSINPEAGASDSRHELIIIDAGITGYEQLLDDLRARASEDVRLDVHVIDAGADGVQALSAILAEYSDLDAVHVVSHGTEHGLQLGASWLDAAGVDRDAAAISAWSTALAEGADLLLYGCNLASSSDGLALVGRLAELTGADVAASEDLTGAAALDGDWSLEFATDTIEASVPFSPAAQQAWQGVLAYTEAAEVWSPTTGGSWETKDLSAGPFNVPANAVLEIAISNGDSFSSEVGGVRASGSTVDRVVTLSGADTSGADYVVMHVQANAASQVETYANDTANVRFTLLGYWDSGVYVETAPAASTFQVAGGATWEDHSLSAFGVGANDVVEVLLSNSNAVNSRDAGVRTDGSTLDRLVDLSSTENGGSQFDTMFVQAGDSASATIEAFARNKNDIAFTVLGYWSTAPDVYVEAIADIGTPAADAAWSAVDLSSFGIPGDTVVEISFGNDESGVSDNELGVRETGSSLDFRRLDLRQPDGATGSGPDRGRMHVNADAASAIEFYHTDVSDQYDFLLTGYWSAVAPVISSDPLWLSTRADVTTGGQPGDDTWQDEDLILIGEPNLALGPTTNGTFAVAFDTTLYAPTADLNATHYVTRNMVVGAASFQLKAGDLLLSTVDDASTFTSASAPTAPGFTNNLTVNNEDVFVFRPDVFGDYSAGTFAMLLDNATGTGADVLGISLIERDVTVGDADLEAGDFLYTRFGDNDVFLFDTLQVGTGITNGARSVLLEGGDPGISISNNQFGIDVIEKTVTLGGQVLASGTVLLTSEFGQNVGTNNLAVTDFDVYALDVKKTTLVSGVSNGLASASMVFDGSDVGFNTGAEQLRSITLTTVQNTAPVLTPAAPSLTPITEDDTNNIGDLVSAIVGTTITDDDAGDSQGIALTGLGSGNGTWEYSTDGGSSWNAVGAVADGSALLLRTTDYVRFVPNGVIGGSASITYRAWDQSTGTAGERADASVAGGASAFSKGSNTAGITVTDVNDAPVLDNSVIKTDYTDGAGPVVIDPGMGVDDPDGLDFSGGVLTVQFTVGNDAGDILSVRDEGGGLGQVSVSGTTVRYNFGAGAVDIGTLSGGTDAAGPLQISFNAAADEAAVQAVARNVTYDNASTVPSEAKRRVQFTLTDGDGGTSNAETVEVDFEADRVLWLSAKGDETPSDALGGTENWLSGDVVRFGDGATFEPTGPGPTTGGAFDNSFSFTGLNTVTGSPEQVDLRALHYVGIPTVLGSGGDTFTVQPGDLIGAIDNTDTIRLTSIDASTIDVTRKDVFVFRPDTPGDYTAGTFTLLLSNPFGNNIHAITLIEEITRLGGGGANDLNPGDFLVAYSGPGDHDDVYKFTPSKVVTATDVGTPTKLLEGATLGFTDQVQGLDMLEKDVTIGDTTLAKGQLLMSLNMVNTVAGLAVTPQDIFLLDVTDTELSGGTAATATLLFDGSDVSLADPNEDLDGLALARLGSVNTNAAPTADIASAAYSVSENSTLALTGQIMVADADAGGAPIVVTVSVDEGTLTVDPDTTGVTAGGTGTGTVTLTGSQAQINSLLAGAGSASLGYDAVDLPSASATLTVTVDDQGNTGGNPKTGSDTATLDITAQNDAPVLSVQPTAFINEFHYDNVGVDSGEFVEVAALAGTDLTGWNLVFYNGNGGLVYRTTPLSGVVPDLGAGMGTVTVYLPANGIQNATGGDADGIALVDVGGTVIEFISYGGTLTALDGPAAGMNSTDIGVAEDGTTPVGHSLQLTGAGATFAWGATASPETPDAANTGQDFTAAVAALTEQVLEDGTLVFSTGNGNALTVADPDAGTAGDPLQITLTVTQGTLTLGGILGLTGVAGDGTGSVSFAGTAAEINTALDGLTYAPTGDFAGTDRLAIVVNDGGNTGLGGPLTDTGHVQIAVTPVNDEPSFTLAGNQTVDEDSGPHVVAGFAAPSAGGGADENTQTFTYTVTGNTNAGLFAAGPAIDSNGELTYTLTPDANGTATITVEMQDSGGTGNGGDDTSATVDFDITVNPMNDAPVLTGANDLSAINEDPAGDAGSLVSDLLAGQVSDIDPAAMNGIAVIGVDDTNGTWEYTTDGGSNWFAFGAVDASSARLLAADASTSVRFVPDGNWNGTVSDGMTFHAWDQTAGIAGDTADITTARTVRDEFAGGSFNGNDGTATWSGAWQQLGETDGPDSGAVKADGTPAALEFGGDEVNISGDGVLRQADLTGATSATLTLDVWRSGNDNPSVTLAVSSDGVSWVDLDTFAMNTAPTSATTFTYDISTFASTATSIRLLGAGSTDDTAYLYFDNVQIEYQTADSVGGTTAFSAASHASSVTVDPVNDAPSFTVAGDQTVDEDSGPHTVAGFATPAAGGGADESGQTFTFTASNDNAALFAVGPAIDASGQLTYTLNPNVSGTATVTVSVRDDGGTANAGDDTSPDQTFDIVVNSVNDEPSFTTLGNQSVNEDSGPHTVAGFATPAAGGGADESGQSFTYTVGNDNAGLFAVGPAIDSSGQLTYTLNPDVSGTATVTVSVRDDGGTTNGGDDTSSDQTFDIVVAPVNDEPSFTVAGNQSVDEDSGPHTVAGFATPAAGGGADESGQSFTYTVGNDNAGLFAVGPAIDSSGQLTYTLNPDVSGTATVTVSVSDDGGTANGGDDTSPDQTFDIVVNPINDEPSFTVAGNQSVDEDSGPHTVAGFATPAPGGGADESGQSFTYTVSNDNAGLFAVGPTIDASGQLTYTLNPNVSGTATVTVSVSDDGGTANGGDDTSPDQTFDIVVAPVNDEPSFTTLGNQSVNEDSGPHTVAGFATPAAGGGADESGQSFTFTVSNDNAGLFAVGPAIDSSGQLTYTLNPNVSGTATVTVSVRDDGGTANGGDDTSPDQTFDIVVNPVNDEPSFTTLGNQTVDEDSGPHTVAGFATPAAGGGADESGQSFTYTVSNDNAGLFAVGPAIDASGQLTYTLNPNAAGTATVTVSVSDDGGTANGGDDTSPDQTFDIVVNPVNDEPSFTTLGNQTVNEDSGPHAVAGFATPAAGGGADESGQTFTFTASNDNAALFAVGPAIDASGQLTYTLNPNVSGTATVTVSVRDDGGTANAGDDTSPDQTFDIVVNSVNDEPSFTTLGNQSVNEDSGPHTVAGFATPAAGGGADESGQSFTYTVSNDNAGLFAVGPAIDASGQLTYTLNPNAAGTATVTVSVSDDGGTANGGDDTSPDQTFDIVVNPVNDEPSFTTLGNQTVNEDSGPHAVAGFATPAAGGGADESGQTFTFTVSNDNAALFAVGPAIDASGQLTYTLNPNVSGTATVTVSVSDDGGTGNGGDDTSPDQTFDIVVAPVNDAPSFTVAGNQSVNEDSGPHTVAGFATPAPGGGADEAGQSFTYTVSNNNAGLFAVGPAIDASGTLTYTLNPNVSGTATVTVSVSDDGGTGNGGDDTSPDQTFDIVVAPVNDAPSFTTLGNQAVDEDSGPHTVAGFATPAAGGGADESGQSFTYTVSNDNAGLFAVGPAIDASGTLTYTLNPNVSGAAAVTVSVSDDGGTANGGDDTSPDQTFDIVVAPVNDEPSFTTLGNQNVAEDSGLHTVAGFATPAAGGGADESGQSFTYTVSNDNAALFAVAPVIDASGTLSYTLNPSVTGSATVTVSVSDDGGTANGGDDTSPDQSFNIVVTAFNTAPDGADATRITLEDTAHLFAVGDFGFSDTDGHSLQAVRITSLPGAGTLSHNASAVSVGDVVSALDIAAGKLVFTPSPDASGGGYASFTFQVQDDGGTASGGVDLDPTPNTIVIDVTAVNDPPSGVNTTVTTSQDTGYVFLVSDFGFSDPAEGNALLGLEITTLPGAGLLTNAGIALSPGDTVSAADIAAGRLVFTPVAADPPSPDPEPAAPEPSGELPPTPSDREVATPAARTPVVLASDDGVVGQPDSTPPTLTSSGPKDGASILQAPIPVVPKVESLLGPSDLATADGERPDFVAIRAGIALALDRVRNSMDEESGVRRFELGQSTGAALGLSVGYVSWLLRGGVLLSSVLSSLPAWRFIDPLPVFSAMRSRRAQDDGEDESLEEIVEGAPDNERAPPPAPADDTAAHTPAAQVTIAEPPFAPASRPTAPGPGP